MSDTGRGGRRYRYNRTILGRGLARSTPGSLPDALEAAEMVYELLGGFDGVGEAGEWMEANQIATLAGKPVGEIEASVGALVSTGFVEERAIEELERSDEEPSDG